MCCFRITRKCLSYESLNEIKSDHSFKIYAKGVNPTEIIGAYHKLSIDEQNKLKKETKLVDKRARLTQMNVSLNEDDSVLTPLKNFEENSSVSLHDRTKDLPLLCVPETIWTDQTFKKEFEAQKNLLSLFSPKKKNKKKKKKLLKKNRNKEKNNSNSNENTLLKKKKKKKSKKKRLSNASSLRLKIPQTANHYSCVYKMEDPELDLDFNFISYSNLISPDFIKFFAQSLNKHNAEKVRIFVFWFLVSQFLGFSVFCFFF